MIKAAKKAIHAVLGNADVNDKELVTALVGVEALLNSRPLTYQSADVKDTTPLTPNLNGHLLSGCGQLLAVPSLRLILFCFIPLRSGQLYHPPWWLLLEI